MKPTTEIRNSDFLSECQNVIVEARRKSEAISVARAAEIAAMRSAPRFYINALQAERILTEMIRNGKNANAIAGFRRRSLMWNELLDIMRRSKGIRNGRIHFPTLVSIIERHPASSFFISPLYARQIFYRHTRQNNIQL